LVDEGFSCIEWVTSAVEWEYITEYGNGLNILIVAGKYRDATGAAAQILIQWL
jgi:hypothetical protein